MSLPITHTLLLLTSIVFSFFWASNPEMSGFTFQLVGFLAAIFYIHDLIARHRSKKSPIQSSRNIINSIIITVVLLLLVLSTGNLISPLFFLLDFLVIYLSLIFFPGLGFTVSLALTVIFLLNNDISSFTQLLNLVSLLLMAPLALFFGNQYLQVLDDNNQIKVLKHQAKQLETTISKEETATLLWLSIEFKNKLHHAIDLVSQLSSSLNNIPHHQKEQLTSLYSDLKKLFKSGEELEDKIDKLTDEA